MVGQSCQRSVVVKAGIQFEHWQSYSRLAVDSCAENIWTDTSSKNWGYAAVFNVWKYKYGVKIFSGAV